MLSLFPQILFLAPFSALLIRVALGILFALSAWRRASQPGIARAWSLAEAAVAIALLLGAWTQASALIAGVLVVVGLLYPRVAISSRSTALLALVMCCSLLVTGAGALALDLPL